jgi:hypothetical protein
VVTDKRIIADGVSDNDAAIALQKPTAESTKAGWG